ncbi:hypothetical protein GNF78_15565 [Clostridium perfringens]
MTTTQPVQSGTPIKPGRKKPRDFNALTPAWNVFFNIIIGLFSFSCVFPFLFVIMISLTDEQTLVLEGFSLWPGKFSPAADS